MGDDMMMGPPAPGMLGANPNELRRMLMLEQLYRQQQQPPQFSAGYAPPPERNMLGQVPAGGFSPRDLFGIAANPLRMPVAGLLGRGLAAADPAERMFAPSMWSFLRGL